MSDALEALECCRRAWEKRQPQMILEGWTNMVDGLDERSAESLGSGTLVEPVDLPDSLGGLDSIKRTGLELVRSELETGPGGVTVPCS